MEGLVEVLLDATQRYDQSLTLERLSAWQAALFPTGRSGLLEIRVGTLRGRAPMQIVSGPIGRERVLYEAPPRARLGGEMRVFLNERQLKALNRMLDEEPGGFVGGMTNKKYVSLTKASPATAQRDLAGLVETGCLVLVGSGRGARYELRLPSSPTSRAR